MAVKPRTLHEAKTVYSTNWELVWWVFMRISGLALIFLVFGHLFFNNIQINVGEVDFAYVATRFSRSWVKIYDYSGSNGAPGSSLERSRRSSQEALAAEVSGGVHFGVSAASSMSLSAVLPMSSQSETSPPLSGRSGNSKIFTLAAIP